MRNTLCATPEPHLLAEVIPAFPADGTLTTWEADLEGNPVADAETVHLGTKGHHRTRRFMAQGQGGTCTKVAVGELLVVGDVGAADARRLDTDLELAGAGLVNGPDFLQDQIY